MKTKRAPKGYSALLERNLPRPIRSRNEYDSRLDEVSALMARDRTAAETEYLELLILLINAFEAEHVGFTKASPLDILHELMNARGMRQRDLARLTGSSGIASEIYTGKRRISIGLAKKFGKHFGVSPGIFI